MTETLPSIPRARAPLDRYPSMNPLPLDLVRGMDRAMRFLRRRDVASIRPTGRRRDRSDLARALVESNARWGNDVSAEVERWLSGDSVTLIGGQQVCFAGGPLLILDKIASLIRVRHELAERSVPATVFFWMATEDHDFEEVSTVSIQDREGLHTIRSAFRPPLRHIVGDLPLPEDLTEAFLARTGVERPFWLREGITFRDSFAVLISTAFAGRGVVLVDSLLPELRRCGRDLFLEVADTFDELQDSLRRRSKELEGAGYREQVHPGEDGTYSLLYRIDEKGIRVPLLAGAAEAVGAAPERISTAALARPLLQDLAFETDLFLGGPAEVAYYAQAAPLYERLGIRQPHVALRGHLLVAPTRVLRTARKYGIEDGEMFDSVDSMIRRREGDGIETIRAAIDEREKRIMKELEAIRALVLHSDPGLRRSVDRTLRRMQYHLTKLSQRGEQAAIRRDEERYRALQRLSETLLPDGIPQDRVAGWISWWFQFKDHLVERAIGEILPDSDSVVVVGL